MAKEKEPQFVQEMKARPWCRADHTPEEQWAIAQKWEAEFWHWYITEERNFDTRSQFLVHQEKLGLDMASGFPQGFELAGRVLDVGCGVTSVLEGWAGVEVVAIDPLLEAYNAMMPEFAVLGQVGNCEYRSCLIEHVHEEDFDVAWSYNVIDHAPGWQDIIGHMYRVLKIGGLFLLGVDVAERRFGGQARRMLHPSIIRHDDLLDCIEEVGFSIEYHTKPDEGAVRTRVVVAARK